MGTMRDNLPEHMAACKRNVLASLDHVLLLYLLLASALVVGLGLARLPAERKD